ncbi:Flagellin [Anaerobiospirillum thomasii]|nr:Flagellin [Anaerobiospirillum thomasii]
MAVQSSNGTNNAKDREAIQQEVTQLSNEITRIACQTKFGGDQMLAGGSGTANQMKGLLNSIGELTIQVGAYKGDSLTMKFNSSGFTMAALASAAQLKDDGSDGFDKAHGGFTVSLQSKAALAIDAVDKIVGIIDSQRASLGAMQNRMESSIRNQANVSMNVSDARARIRDTDFAEESAKLSQQTIIQQAASSMLTQANSRPQLALSLLR